MIGPLSLAQYNSINFFDVSTFPPGFNTVAPKRVIDLQGLIMHELLHGLGYASNIGGYQYSNDIQTGVITLPPPDQIPKQFQRVTLMDLYRFNQSTANGINTWSDFTHAARFWDVDAELLGTCRAADQGTAVIVTGIKSNNSEKIPMSSGEQYTMSSTANGIDVDPCIKGDCYQSSHARNPFNIIPTNGLPPEFTFFACQSLGGTGVVLGLIQSFQFFPDTSNQSPPGMLMRPFSGFHNPNLLTTRDLKVLDLIGWDVDYQGNQPTVLNPVSVADVNNSVDQSTFELQNGVNLIRVKSNVMIEH
jgi:hypothetical protein